MKHTNVGGFNLLVLAPGAAATRPLFHHSKFDKWFPKSRRTAFSSCRVASTMEITSFFLSNISSNSACPAHNFSLSVSKSPLIAHIYLPILSSLTFIRVIRSDLTTLMFLSVFSCSVLTEILSVVNSLFSSFLSRTV